MERFGDLALQLAGFAGALLGWSPDAFWGCTPAELAVVVRTLTGAGDGAAVAPPDAATLAWLREAYPDG